MFERKANHVADAVHHRSRCGFAGLGILVGPFGRLDKLIMTPTAIRFPYQTAVSKRIGAQYICTSVSATSWIVQTGLRNLFNYRVQRPSPHRVVTEPTSVATVDVTITRALAANPVIVEKPRKLAASGATSAAGNRCCWS